MQSKRKFLQTVSTEPPPLTATEKATIRAAIRVFDEGLPADVFTGLDTKARVTVNANACWENTQQEGGTIDAISEIVHLGSVGVPCKVRDLFTGEVTSEEILENITPGTYVFWSCLDVVLKSDPAEIRKAALVMISEPGKARTVTKASAALKIVLDVVNKICSWPLSKIESSKSGMGRSAHAWNSFKSAFTAEGKDFAFNISREEVKKQADGSLLVTKHYRDMWNSSTDFEEATDSMNHEVARIISKYWMKKCGIPPILQAVVFGTCFMPRDIVFEAHGSMAVYGLKWKHDSPFLKPRYVTLVKGVLMGDPLTKVILHLVNILVRVTGEKYANADFIEKIFPMESREVKEYLEEYSCTSEAGENLPKDTSLPTGDLKTLSVGSGLSPGFSEGVVDAPKPQELPVPYMGTKPSSSVTERPETLPPGFHFNLREAILRDKTPSAKSSRVVPVSQGIRLNGTERRKHKFDNFAFAAAIREAQRVQRIEEAKTAQIVEQERLSKLVRNWKPVPTQAKPAHKRGQKPAAQPQPEPGCFAPFRAMFY
jgi:hypothetical protein